MKIIIKPGMVIETHEGLWVCFPRQEGKIGFVNYYKPLNWKPNMAWKEIVNVFDIGKGWQLWGKLLYSIKWEEKSIVRRNTDEFIYILRMISTTECEGLIINTITGNTKFENNISLVGTVLSDEDYLNRKLIRLGKKLDGYKIINLFVRSDIKPGMIIVTTSSTKYKVVDDGQLRLLNDENILIKGTIKDYWNEDLSPINYSVPIKEIIDENNKTLYYA